MCPFSITVSFVVVIGQYASLPVWSLEALLTGNRLSVLEKSWEKLCHMKHVLKVEVACRLVDDTWTGYCDAAICHMEKKTNESQ